jgi:hypothetical protein
MIAFAKTVRIAFYKVTMIEMERTYLSGTFHSGSHEQKSGRVLGFAVAK